MRRCAVAYTYICPGRPVVKGENRAIAQPLQGRPSGGYRSARYFLAFNSLRSGRSGLSLGAVRVTDPVGRSCRQPPSRAIFRSPDSERFSYIGGDAVSVPGELAVALDEQFAV